MTDEPTKDAEAIAALDALKPETQYIGIASMRRALDAACAYRRALLPNAPATEDALDKKATERDEVTDHDDLQAAECIRYQQSREKD